MPNRKIPRLGYKGVPPITLGTEADIDSENLQGPHTSEESYSMKMANFTDGLSGITSDLAGFAASEVLTALPSSTVTQRYIKPSSSASAFQINCVDDITGLGNIPSGGPSWVTDTTNLNIVMRGQLNTTSTMLLSTTNFGHLMARLFDEAGGSTSPFIYWAVFNTSSNLVGVTRTKFRNVTYSNWVAHHTGDNPTQDAEWWEWGTTNLPSGSAYTVTSDTTNHVRSIPYRNYTSSYNTVSYGLHYKRTGTGAHYPWHNSSSQINNNGYFYPSSTNGLSGNGYIHYFYIAEN